MHAVSHKSGVLMRYMEGIPAILNRTAKPGDLIKFKFLGEKIAGNMHQMEEAVGIVTLSKDDECLVLVGNKIIKSCWIVEIVKSV